MQTTTVDTSAHEPRASGPVIVLETWFLRCHGGRWQTCTPDVAALEGGMRRHPHPHPHLAALAVAVERGVRADVVHSTSWRMVADQLVVTYIVVTQDDIGPTSFDVHDDRTHEFVGTAADHTVVPIDPTRPPEMVTDWEVIHHALHHLALLAATNASISAALSPAARTALRPLVPEGAGVLGRATHAS